MKDVQLHISSLNFFSVFKIIKTFNIVSKLNVYITFFLTYYTLLPCYSERIFIKSSMAGIYISCRWIGWFWLDGSMVGWLDYWIFRPNKGAGGGRVPKLLPVHLK